MMSERQGSGFSRVCAQAWGSLLLVSSCCGSTHCLWSLLNLLSDGSVSLTLVHMLTGPATDHYAFGVKGCISQQMVYLLDRMRGILKG